MSNELAGINDSLQIMNRNIGSITNVLLGDKNKKIIEQSNNKANKPKGFADVVSDIKGVISKSVNSFRDNQISKMVDKSVKQTNATTNKKTINKVINNVGINGTTLKPKNLNNSRIINDKNKGAFNLLITSAIDFFQFEKKDRNKNQNKSLFSKAVDKGKSIKDTVVDKSKVGLQNAKKGLSLLDGLTLVGVGAYALYEALTSKIGKWTGSIKLIGKSFMKMGTKILKPFTNMGNMILKPFMNLTGSILKPLTRMGKKGALKVLGVSKYKTVAKTVGKLFGKSAIKKIPIIGAIAGLGFGIKRASEGDLFGGLLELASGVAGIVPVAGTAIGLGIDLFLAKRDYDKASGGKPTLLNTKSIENSIKNSVKWDNVPIIGGLINGYKSFQALQSGNYKEAIHYGSRGILSTIPGFLPILDLLSDEQSEQSLSKTIKKGNIANVVTKKMNNMNKDVETSLNDYSKSIIKPVKDATSSNEIFYKRDELEKSKKKDDVDSKKMKQQDELIKINKKQLKQTEHLVYNSQQNNENDNNINKIK